MSQQRNVAVLTGEKGAGIKQTGFLLENDDQLRALESMPYEERPDYAELHFEVCDFAIEAGDDAARYPAIVSAPSGLDQDGYAVTASCEQFDINKAALKNMFIPNARPEIIQLAFPTP